MTDRRPSYQGQNRGRGYSSRPTDEGYQSQSRGGGRGRGNYQSPRDDGRPGQSQRYDGRPGQSQGQGGQQGQGFQRHDSPGNPATSSFGHHTQQQHRFTATPGYSGGARGRGSALAWSSEVLPVDLAPVSYPSKWKHPDLPSNLDDIKTLIPRRKCPGQAYQHKIKAITNHFLVNIKPPEELYRYEINTRKIKDNRPEAKPKSGSAVRSEPGTDRPPGTVNRDITKKILRHLIPQIKEQWDAESCPKLIGMIHDFSRILITNKSLEPIVGLVHSVAHSDLTDEDSEICRYEITLAPAAFTVDLGRVRELLEDSINVDHPELFEIKQVYNILLKNLGGNRYAPYGRSSILRISEPTRENRLGEGLMNWKGVAAVCTVGTTWKPFINIDIQNCAIVIGQPVLDTIREIFESNRSYASCFDVRTWKSKDFESVNGILKTRKVRRIVKRKIIDKVVRVVERKTASELTFSKDGNQISVAKYFRDENVTINYSNGPVLNLGGRNTDVYVPAEFCTIKSGQSINRLLPPNATKNMVEQATRKPIEKYNDIKAAVIDLQLQRNQIFEDFGVSFPSEMHQLEETRVLAPPELCYGKRAEGSKDEKSRARITPSDGQWDVWSHKIEFYTTTTVDAWAILYVGLQFQPNPTQFINQLIDQGRQKGMNFPEPTTIESARIRDTMNYSQDNVNSISSSLQRIKTTFQHKKKCFVICVIQQKGSSLYCQVKQAAERDGHAEVLTQCIIEKNFSKANHSVVKNLLLKINSKLGGINHVPIFPTYLAKANIMSVPTLILGIDVNHPSLPLKGRPEGFPSFAAVTGSLDRTGMPYMMHIQAQIRIVNNKTIGAAEVIQGLDVIVTNMLKEFKARTRCEPQRIIVFRDGVGDNQFPEILQVEMGAIRRACSSLSQKYQPAITILAVQKRHKVRFFLKENGQISPNNVPPGTVVDTEITRDDFYLLSHKGMLGTSRPTHYHVLWDDSDFSTDEIQGLTYFLCYMYSRCNRSVSYPAPTYYAHWAAMRANNLAHGYMDWDGGQESVNRLNASLARSSFIKQEFPMHFI